MSTQIIEMFKQSNNRMNKIMRGGADFKLNEIQAAQREFEGQIKLVNSIVAAYGIMSKNARAVNGLKRMNILDGSTAIDLGLGDPETDKVKCPYKNGDLITRAECLEYSDIAKDNFECKGCEIGKETKENLVGPPLHTA